MATYSFTTTQEQDDALAWKLRDVNRERAGNGQTPITLNLMIQAGVREKLLEPLVGAYKQEEGVRVKEALKAATPNQWTQIKAVLGL